MVQLIGNLVTLQRSHLQVAATIHCCQGFFNKQPLGRPALIDVSISLVLFVFFSPLIGLSVATLLAGRRPV